jgi:hypothetical protein
MAESQDRTTITISAMIPLTISTSPKSGPGSSASLLSSFNDLSILREMLGLPDRESSSEEMDDDDNNGLKYLFWISPDMKSPSNSLRLSSSVLKPPPPSLRPQVSAPKPSFPPQSPCPPSPPRLRRASRAYLIGRRPGGEHRTPEGQEMGYGTQAYD